MEELLKQVLNEMQELKEGQKQIINRLGSVEQSQTRMENTMADKFGGIFDAREVQFDVNERICDSLNRIEGKLDRISLKVSSHDTLLRQVK